VKNNTVWIGLIIVIALIVRIYRLDSLPYGFHVDEVKAGWNAWSIWKTGKDDLGKSLPMYYNSIGDFRPTGIIYLLMPFVAIFGRTVTSTRLPSAIFGALTILPLYLLINEVIEKKRGQKIGLIAGIFWTFSIWQINVSRATAEAVISTFLAIFGLYFVAKSANRKGWLNVIWSILFLGSSYFFYHSIRITAPILVLILIGWQYKKIKAKKTVKQITVIIIGIFLLSAIIMNQKEARGRMSAITIFSDASINGELIKMPTEEGSGHVLMARIFHNKAVVYGRTILNEYLSYFSPGFLVGNSAKPARYVIPNIGLMTYAEFGLLILGLIYLGKSTEVGVWWLMLLVTPLPAIITNEDVPNLMRTFLMVPFLVIIESYGLYLLLEIKKWGKILAAIFLIAWTINLIYYFHMYYRHEAQSIASYNRDGGNVELATEINKLKNNFDQIYLPNYPDNLYPWIGYLGNNDPKKFNPTTEDRKKGAWTFENINFTSMHCPTDRWLKDHLDETLPKGKLLVVNSEGCEVDLKAVEKRGFKYLKAINRMDGSKPYEIWEKE
jgi:hypothetical protein